MKKSLRGNLLLLLTAMIWGAAFVAQRAAMDDISPFTFNSIRFLLAAVVLVPVIFFLDKREGKKFTLLGTDDPKAKRTLLIGGLACGTVLAIASSLQQFGVMTTSAGKAGFITALYMVIVPILGLFLKKKVSILVWISVAVAVVGMYLLTMNEALTISTGDLLVLACAFGFAVHILVIDHFSPLVDCVRMSCMQFLVAGVLGLICMFIFEKPNIDAILAAWLPIVYAGVMSSSVGYTLQIVAQKDTNPVIASLLMSLESVFAVLAGWILLKETMSLREILGCVLIFAAVLAAQAPDFIKTSARKKDEKGEEASTGDK